MNHIKVKNVVIWMQIDIKLVARNLLNLLCLPIFIVIAEGENEVAILEKIWILHGRLKYSYFLFPLLQLFTHQHLMIVLFVRLP